MGGCCASKNVSTPVTEAPAAPAPPKPQEEPQQTGDNASDNTRLPSDTSNGFHAALRIFEGIVLGFLGEALPKVLETLTEGDLVFDEVKTAVETYKEGDAVKALGQLAKALRGLPGVLTAAGSAALEVERFAAALAILDTPEKIFFSVGRELLVNGKDILADIEAAVAAWKESDWLSFGKSIGSILGELTAYGSQDSAGVERKEASTVAVEKGPSAEPEVATGEAPVNEPASGAKAPEAPASDTAAA